MPTLVDFGGGSYLYRLCWSERDWLRLFAEEVEAYKLQQPQVGENRKKVSRRSSVEIKTEGFYSEYVASYHFAVPFREDVTLIKDDGIDLLLIRYGEEVGIDVKSFPFSSKSYPNMYVGKYCIDNAKHKADFFLFCYVDLDTGEVELTGALDRERVQSDGRLDRFVEGGPLNYVFSRDLLRPVPPPVSVGADEEKRRFFYPSLRRNHYLKKRHREAVKD